VAVEVVQERREAVVADFHLVERVTVVPD